MNRLPLLCLILSTCVPQAISAAQLLAGTAKVEITDRNAGLVNDPAWAKALVLKQGDMVAVIVTVDAVAIGEIGRIPNSYLGSVRAQLQKDLGIQPKNVFANASHCHHIVRTDSDRLTVQAVKEAFQKLEPVKVGAGRGFENRIQENRRMWMKDGTQTDVRRAYSMPRDEDVASAGPIDPEIGILRIDRTDGRPLAVLYNFAAHPIHGVPNGGNTADYPAFASKAIEENTGGNAMAFFIQGCAGDINPSKYKDVHQPHDAEPLGNLLGLSVLRAWRAITPKDPGDLRVVNEPLALPRSPDFAQRMAAIEAEQKKLLAAMQGTSLNFKTFLPLYVQYKVTGEFPSFYSHRYMHEEMIGRNDLKKLDEENRANMDQYLRNIDIMERLTRLQTNYDLLKKHQAEAIASGSKTIDVEVAAIKVGDFRLVTFPGELTVEIGLGLKKRVTTPTTFVAGYTNGYLYYTATTKQRANTGYAQEDCDARVAPEWQPIFEAKALDVLKALDAR